MAIARMTNVEFLVDLMESSTTGSLMQAFIIEAIVNYGEQTLQAPPWPESAATFINQDAWKRAAQECLDAIKARNTI